MKLAIIDFETYWSASHSLSKISPIEYCMHPETELISLAYKIVGDGRVRENVIFGEDNIIEFVEGQDWSDTLIVGHNLSGFDSMLLAWRLGVKPKMWGCTLAMAAPFHSKDPGLSLAKLVEHYEIGVKDNTALVNTKGKHLEDFTDDERDAMREYNMADVQQCYELFKILKKKISNDEMKLIDMTVRMLVEPQFDVDDHLLNRTLRLEKKRKRAMLLELASILGVLEHDEDATIEAVTKTLASAKKFSEVLREIGVDVPTKVSPTTGKEIPALAKTDEEFLALTEHEDDTVSAAANARLGVKSTLLETRMEAFRTAAKATGGRLPIPLKYCGAGTTWRWSGWAYNPQNLPRIGKKSKPSDALRNSLQAPPGHKVVVADLSGIELRVNHFLWRVPSSIYLYRDNPGEADLYREFAASMYDTTPDAVTKDQRQMGKVAHLGLGFGAGAQTFRKVAKSMGGITLDEDEALHVVTEWRNMYPEIVKGWRTCHNALPSILKGTGGYSIDQWGFIESTPNGLRTPKGEILYPHLRLERGDTGKAEFIYGKGRSKARIYAGKITENIVQHLARCVIADQALDIRKYLGLLPALMVHDELVYVVPEDDAEETLANVQKIMRTPPEWWPELITWSEGSIGDTYGAAK